MMLNKKTIKSMLLEIEASCYNYEEYLQEIIEEVLNDKNSNIKYLITRNNNYLCLYKYSESDYISWLYDNCYINNDDISDLINNYKVVFEYVNKNYINYYVEDSILNFISVKKFRNMLYNNNKALLKQVINNIYTNIRKYQDNKYLVYEYNLNKQLYHKLKKIQ